MQRLAVLLVLDVISIVACSSPDRTHPASSDGGRDGASEDSAALQVFAPTTSRFATDFTEWRVPQSGHADGAFFLEATRDSSGWRTFDINGDQTVDFVVLYDPATGTFWNDASGQSWRVYFGEPGGFATDAARWALPSEASVYVEGGTIREIDGDGRPDWVIADAGSGPGRQPFDDGNGLYWKVFLNTGTGFNSTYTRWSVPSGDDARNFGFLGISDGDAWAHIDLDGDAVADLVVAGDSSAEPRSAFSDGSGYFWRLYRGGGNGFASSPTRWSVPDKEGDGSVSGLASYGWSVLDIDGDRRVDLEQFTEEDAQGVPVLSDTEGAHWRVYRNTGAGFAATSGRWHVPIAPTGPGYNQLSGDAGQLEGGSFSTFDIDGDGRVDLVNTEQFGVSHYAWELPDDAGHYWSVYLNDGTGFAEPRVQWRIPPGRGYWGFYLPSLASNAWGFWTTVDINGDERLDFVITAEDTLSAHSDPVFSDAEGPFWKVYLGES